MIPNAEIPTDRRARSRKAPWLLGVSGWLALGALALPAGDPLRVLAIFGFVLVCPGLALVRLLERPDPLEEFVVGLALSMSLAIVVTVAMAVGHWWHPGLCIALLALITTGAVIAGEHQSHRADTDDTKGEVAEP